MLWARVKVCIILERRWLSGQSALGCTFSFAWHAHRKGLGGWDSLALQYQRLHDVATSCKSGVLGICGSCCCIGPCPCKMLSQRLALVPARCSAKGLLLSATAPTTRHIGHARPLLQARGMHRLQPEKSILERYWQLAIGLAASSGHSPPSPRVGAQPPPPGRTCCTKSRPCSAIWKQGGTLESQRQHILLPA